METVQNARYTKQGDECNCLSLNTLKFTRFPARIKAKTLSSNMKRRGYAATAQRPDAYKYSESFLHSSVEY